MSHIKHQMIERRDIDLSISKEELLSKLLATYQIDKISEDLLSKLTVTFSSDVLRIKGVHESVITDITPTYTDQTSIVESPDDSGFYFLSRKDAERVADKLSKLWNIKAEEISIYLNIVSLTSKEAELLGLTNNRISPDKRVWGYAYNGAVFPNFGHRFNQFNNEYFVLDKEHVCNIPNNVEYSREYVDGWSISIMDGTLTATGARRVTMVKKRLTTDAMYRHFGACSVADHMNGLS